MTKMSVIYKSRKFTLGKCNCGCNEEIGLRRTDGYLRRFTLGHNSRGIEPPHYIGKDHPNWKGGKSKHSNGYIEVLNPDHPFANTHGYVMEHRLVMEEYLDRYLEANEIVHHKNGDKTDNKIENLELMSWSEHAKHHFPRVPKYNGIGGYD